MLRLASSLNDPVMPEEREEGASWFGTRVNQTQFFVRPRISRETAYGRMGDLFGDEIVAERTLRRMLWPGGFRCRRCGNCRLQFLATRNLYQCRRCRGQQSITAGTPLAGTRTRYASWGAILFHAWLPIYAPTREEIRDEYGISLRQIDRRLDLLRSDDPAVLRLLAAYRREMERW